MRKTPLVEMLLIAVFLPTLGWAQTPNNGTSVSAQANSQAVASVTSDGAGGVIAVWDDTRSGSNDIYAQRLNASGQALWVVNGTRVCGAASTQTSPQVIGDGQGGAIVVWQDFRNGQSDIYAQRLNASGSPQWASDGVPLCQSSGEQTVPVVTSDGANGAIVAWQDTRNGGWDIFAQRITGAGVPFWTVNGVGVVNVGNDQIRPVVVSDGAGGAIVGWEDYRSGAGDIYSQHLNPAGVPQWTANGIEICIASNTQQRPAAAADGLGGIVVAWEDYRNGPLNIYSQRLNGNGVPIWTVNGVALCTTAGGASAPVITGAGGAATVAWQDQRSGTHIYAQQVSPTGLPQWTGNGVPVCTASGAQYFPSIASTGSGACFISWYDTRSGSEDIYAQEINSSGAPAWATDGVRVCDAPGMQLDPKVCSDGAGGGIVVWVDYRYQTAPDLFAQRVQANGDLVFPDSEYPRLISVRDVPNDQGLRVKLSWRASNQDFPPFNRVQSYWIWRSVPSQTALAAIRGGAPVSKGANESASFGGYRVTTVNGVDFYWEYLASQPSGHLENYSYVAATTSDSIAGSNPYTAFMIEAVGTNVWWYSNPDSGYSVDNLAPVQPQPFTANYQPNGVGLHWGVSSAIDLQTYRLYRGDSPDFETNSDHLIATPPDTGFFDADGSGLNFYRLTAVDVHGNESASALVGPGPTTGVEGVGSPARITSIFPNPALSGRMWVSFRITQPGPTRLELYDVSGRRVEVVDLPSLGAGDQRVAVQSHATAGVYHVKLVQHGSTNWSRVSIVR